MAEDAVGGRDEVVALTEAADQIAKNQVADPGPDLLRLAFDHDSSEPVDSQGISEAGAQDELFGENVDGYRVLGSGLEVSERTVCAFLLLPAGEAVCGGGGRAAVASDERG